MLYVGAESAGCMAFIDASEMPDTYGSPFDQIRGFVEGGWGQGGVENATGDISGVSGLHRISSEHFRADILHTLGGRDTVVVVAHNGSLTKNTLSLAEEVGFRCPVMVLAAVNRSLLSAESAQVLASLAELTPTRVVVSLSQQMEGLLDYSLKLLLNAVSTYAQAAGRGAVYKGLMVTTGPANDKIYNR
jgi:N-acetylmuramic acid 6-phosphate (MurNAc-6-P) etherase